MDYNTIPKLFEYVITRELPIEVLDELEFLKEKGTLSDPTSPALNWKFTQLIKKAIERSAKLYGVRVYVGHNNPYNEENDILTSLFIQTYPHFNDMDKIEEALTPRSFVVGSESKPLPFVGGSRQGQVDGLYYDDIESVFGPPSYEQGSGDGKVQLEWDIEFDNGVRATIYDYKQYDVDPYNDIDYWSVGGNSAESAFEVYKSLGLI